MRVIWSIPALQDIGRIYDYVAGFNPIAAAELARQLKHAGETLRNFSGRGKPIGKMRRELLVIWPYVIRYRVRGQVVEIMRIRHGRRKRLR